MRIEHVGEDRLKDLLHDIITELEKLESPNLYNKALFDGLHDKIARTDLTSEYYILD